LVTAGRGLCFWRDGVTAGNPEVWSVFSAQPLA
jgi:hypothetical protein